MNPSDDDFALAKSNIAKWCLLNREIPYPKREKKNKTSKKKKKATKRKHDSSSSSSSSDSSSSDDTDEEDSSLGKRRKLTAERSLQPNYNAANEPGTHLLVLILNPLVLSCGVVLVCMSFRGGPLRQSNGETGQDLQCLVAVTRQCATADHTAQE